MKIAEFGRIFKDEKGCIVVSDFKVIDCTSAEAKDNDLVIACAAQHLLKLIGMGEETLQSLNAERVVIKAIQKARA